VPQTRNIIFADNSVQLSRFRVFAVRTQLDNILESRTLKVNQLHDEVFDKPSELEELRATSGELPDMYDQVVSSIRRFIDKIKPKPE
jgi:hypothetical protein